MKSIYGYPPHTIKRKPREVAEEVLGKIVVGILFIGFWSALYTFLPGGAWIWTIMLVVAIFGASGGGSRWGD